MSGLGWESNGGGSGSGGVTSLALDNDDVDNEPSVSGSTGDITIHIPEADGLNTTGTVNTGTQFIGGEKHFVTSIVVENVLKESAGNTIINGFGGVFNGKEVLTPAAAVDVDVRHGNTFIITPDQNLTLNLTNIQSTGQSITFFIKTSGTSSFTVTFGTGLVDTGNLATGTVDAKTFIVEFRSDGTSFYEAFRSAALS